MFAAWMTVNPSLGPQFCPRLNYISFLTDCNEIIQTFIVPRGRVTIVNVVMTLLPFFNWHHILYRQSWIGGNTFHDNFTLAIHICLMYCCYQVGITFVFCCLVYGDFLCQQSCCLVAEVQALLEKREKVNVFYLLLIDFWETIQCPRWWRQNVA